MQVLHQFQSCSIDSTKMYTNFEKGWTNEKIYLTLLIALRRRNSIKKEFHKDGGGEGQSGFKDCFYKASCEVMTEDALSYGVVKAVSPVITFASYKFFFIFISSFLQQRLFRPLFAHTLIIFNSIDFLFNDLCEVKKGCYVGQVPGKGFILFYIKYEHK